MERAHGHEGCVEKHHSEALVPAEVIEKRILLIRKQKVMIDSDLAELYCVDTKQLVRQVNRNIKRFPNDFMFRLNKEESTNLRCQFGTSNWGGRRHLPYVFTGQGIAMLSSVLKSSRAIQVNIQIMRTFTRLREMLMHHQDLKRRIEEMEKKYNGQFKIVFDALRQMLHEKEKPKAKIGFLRD